MVASLGVADAFQQEIWKRLSNEKYPHRDLSTALRSGRDDKGESGCGPKQILWKVNRLLQWKVFGRSPYHEGVVTRQLLPRVGALVED